jgi:hypothetical protein
MDTAAVRVVARSHYLSQQALAELARRRAAELWRSLDAADLSGSWRSGVGPAVTRVVAASQFVAASQADRYTDAVLDAQGASGPADGSVSPGIFAGVASDGRPLESLLYGAVVDTKDAIGGGMPVRDALRRGAGTLLMYVGTQVQDAGRVADGVAAFARPHVTGYYRVLTPPSCSRCAILAGRHYRTNAGFLRHPRCDCRHAPVAEADDSLRYDPMKAFRAGQITDLSRAETRALLDGADMSRVVNARRGMSSAGGLTTSEAAVRGRVRLTPEGLYELYPDRGQAIEQLRRHGYLL